MFPLPIPPTLIGYFLDNNTYLKSYFTHIMTLSCNYLMKVLKLLNNFRYFYLFFFLVFYFGCNQISMPAFNVCMCRYFIHFSYLALDEIRFQHLVKVGLTTIMIDFFFSFNFWCCCFGVFFFFSCS